MSETAVLNKLKAAYTIIDNEAAQDILEATNMRTLPKDSLQKVLFSINGTGIKQEVFVSYAQDKKNTPIRIWNDIFSYNNFSDKNCRYETLSEMPNFIKIISLVIKYFF